MNSNEGGKPPSQGNKYEFLAMVDNGNDFCNIDFLKKRDFEMEKKLINWANKNGFQYDIIVNNSNELKHCGILIHTDYEGMYPDDHTRALHIFISNYARKNGFRYDSRGFWTGAAVIY